MNKKIISILVILVMCLSVTPAFAMSDEWTAKLTSDHYGERATARLLHGVVNIALGWTQLFVEPHYSVKHEDQNWVDGIFDGISKSIYYSVVGVWEAGTFWFPGEGGKEIAITDCVLDTFNR